jgi:hypothetical protein
MKNQQRTAYQQTTEAVTTYGFLPIAKKLKLTNKTRRLTTYGS